MVFTKRITKMWQSFLMYGCLTHIRKQWHRLICRDFSSVKLYNILDVFSKLPAIATVLYLPWLLWANRVIPICVALPKVAKASTVLLVMQTVLRGFFKCKVVFTLKGFSKLPVITTVLYLLWQLGVLQHKLDYFYLPCVNRGVLYT